MVPFQSFFSSCPWPQWDRLRVSSKVDDSLIPWWPLSSSPCPLSLLSISQPFPTKIAEHAIYLFSLGFLCFIKVHLIIRVFLGTPHVRSATCCGAEQFGRRLCPFPLSNFIFVHCTLATVYCAFDCLFVWI